MQIIRKGTTPNGTSLQIEDWSEDYTSYNKNATIGFYPMALESIYREDKPHWTPYPKRGETFRASFNFDTEAEALEAFVLLENGCRCFIDYIENFTGNVISRETFIKAIGQWNCKSKGTLYKL